MFVPIALALLFAGPVPLCLLAAGRERTPSLEGSLRGIVRGLTAWCLVHAAVVRVLCGLARFGPRGVLVAHVAVAAAGTAVLGALRVRGAESTPDVRAGDASGVGSGDAPDVRAGGLTADWVGRGFVFACVAVIAALLFRATREPVGDYDSWMYHLPAMVRAWQSGDFAPLAQWDLAQLRALGQPVDWDNTVAGLIGRYPFGWEIVSAQFILAGGTDQCVTLAHLPVWALGAASVALLSSQCGATRAHALAAGVLGGCVPSALESCTSLHVDAETAAFFAAGLASSVAFLRAPCVRDAAAAVWACALLGFVKASGPVYAVIAVVAAAGAQGLSSVRGAPGIARSLAAGCAAALASAPVGLWFFARNLADTGNPLGSLRIRVMGRTVFPGAVDPAALSRTSVGALFSPWRGADWAVVLGAMLRALSPAFALLVPLALWPARGEVAPARRRFTRVVGAALCACVFLYWRTPYGGDNGSHGWRLTPWIAQAVRYGLPAFALLVALAASGATRARVPDRWVAWVVGVTACMGLVHVAGFLAAGAGVVVASVAWVAWSRSGSRSGSRWGAWALGAGALAVAPLQASTFAAARQARFEGVPECIAARVPEGGVVGYVASHRAFWLSGPRLDRRVEFTPANLEAPSREAWFAGLRARGVFAIAVGPVLPQWQARPEMGWLSAPDAPVTVVHGADPARETVVYVWK